MPGRQTLITPDSWTAYPTSTHLAITSNGSARAFNANTEYYSCYKLEHPGLLSGVQFQVDSGGAGSLKMALYDIGYNGLPSNKLATFNTTSLSTTGTKADTATGTWSPAGGVWLSAGWYYMGFISDIAFSIHGIMAAAAGATPVGRRNSYGYSDTLYIAGSYSTGLPSVPNLTGASMGDPGSGGNCTPWIGLKVIA
jgi:hypothetical protein